MGKLGLRLDMDDQSTAIGEMRKSLNINKSKDLNRDSTIAELLEENQEMKNLLTALAQVLVKKGVITIEELNAMVAPDRRSPIVAAEDSADDISDALRRENFDEPGSTT